MDAGHCELKDVFLNFPVKETHSYNEGKNAKMKSLRHFDNNLEIDYYLKVIIILQYYV